MNKGLSVGLCVDINDLSLMVPDVERMQCPLCSLAYTTVTLIMVFNGKTQKQLQQERFWRKYVLALCKLDHC